MLARRSTVRMQSELDDKILIAQRPPMTIRQNDRQAWDIKRFDG